MSDEKSDGVEIEVRLDDATLARLDWIAERSWTDRETVLRVVIALNVAPSGADLARSRE